MSFLRHALAATASLALAGAAWAADRNVLRIIPVDVEGGAASLYITPQGHSLLIDTGFPAGAGGPRPAPGAPQPPPTSSSAERIATAARAAGLTRIDYLLLSHYHLDHIGGAPELMQLIPIGTLIDHGPARESPSATATPAQAANSPGTRYPAFLAAFGNRPHRVMKPGDTLKIDDLLLTAVDSDREIPARPLAGGGQPGVNCTAATTNDNEGGEENPRSLGIAFTWGRARVLSLGDTTWNVENRLVCPRDLIGPVDLMFVDNHGTSNSNSPQLINTVRPTVMVVNNGPVKGADAATFDTLAASPTIKGVWQVHFATRSPEKNAPADQIANLEGPDAINPLQIEVRKDGSIKMINPRNGFTKTYPKAAR